jgi:hypothetical protein
LRLASEVAVPRFAIRTGVIDAAGQQTILEEYVRDRRAAVT